MFKDTWRRIRKSDGARRVVCWLVAQYIRLVWATGRWEIKNSATPERYWREGKPFVIAFWHGRLLILPAMWPTSAKISMLISMHRDGELIARAIGYFGHGTVRGSAAKPGSDKDKGGVAALRGMLKALKANEYVGITPDGPRGPRMRATDGIVTVARVAGVPIIPCSYSARSRVVLSTWDRFILPLPFTRGVIMWGEPISVPRDADVAALDAARLAVEAGLMAATNDADELMGVAPVEPEPMTQQALAG
ncbi:MAG: lysophospholipid acyltransferase family protein [Alphaproteobacteria bacterium]|nr:lysophospholipid acyltransferase family protein [Alphaproteobacteria bacterium]